MRCAPHRLLLLTLALVPLVAVPFSALAKEAKPPEQSATINGVVLTPEGQPAVGVKVTPFYWDVQKPTVETDDQGKFSFAAPSNRVNGTALRATSREGLLGYSTIIYDKQQAAVPQEIKLAPARLLNVTVHDAQAMPAPKVKVVARARFATIAQAATDEQGKATLRVPSTAQLQFLMAWNSTGLDYTLFRRADEPKSDPYRLAHDHAEPITLTLSPTRSV